MTFLTCFSFFRILGRKNVGVLRCPFFAKSHGHTVTLHCPWIPHLYVDFDPPWLPQSRLSNPSVIRQILLFSLRFLQGPSDATEK